MAGFDMTSYNSTLKNAIKFCELSQNWSHKFCLEKKWFSANVFVSWPSEIWKKQSLNLMPNQMSQISRFCDNAFFRNVHFEINLFPKTGKIFDVKSFFKF